MDITPHLHRLNLACLFYGTALLALVGAGTLDLSTPGVLTSLGVAAAGSTYYHLVKRVL